MVDESQLEAQIDRVFTELVEAYRYGLDPVERFDVLERPTSPFGQRLVEYANASADLQRPVAATEEELLEPLGVDADLGGQCVAGVGADDRVVTEHVAQSCQADPGRAVGAGAIGPDVVDEPAERDRHAFGDGQTQGEEQLASDDRRDHVVDDHMGSTQHTNVDPHRHLEIILLACSVYVTAR